MFPPHRPSVSYPNLPPSTANNGVFQRPIRELRTKGYPSPDPHTLGVSDRSDWGLTVAFRHLLLRVGLRHRMTDGGGSRPRAFALGCKTQRLHALETLTPPLLGTPPCLAMSTTPHTPDAPIQLTTPITGVSLLGEQAKRTSVSIALSAAFCFLGYTSFAPAQKPAPVSLQRTGHEMRKHSLGESLPTGLSVHQR